MISILKIGLLYILLEFEFLFKINVTIIIFCGNEMNLFIIFFSL